MKLSKKKEGTDYEESIILDLGVGAVSVFVRLRQQRI